MRVDGCLGPIDALPTIPRQGETPPAASPPPAGDGVVTTLPGRGPAFPATMAGLSAADPVAAFTARFGTDAPCRPDREPLAALLHALALPEGGDGWKGLWQLLAEKAPGTTDSAETAAELDAGAFARLSSAAARWADRWAEKGGSMADLARIRALQGFVSGRTDGPHPATVGYGPTVATERSQVVSGIRLVAPAGVSEQAVAKAAALIQRMAPPDVAKRLARGDAEVVIIPTNALMTDVSQFQSLRGILTPDGRPWDTVRGVGDLCIGGKRIVALPEESLLDDRKHDPQPAGYSAATHEFAHLILRIGLSRADAKAVSQHYQKQADQGVAAFTDAYAASNVDEYFAQATCAFFGVNTGQGKGRDFLAETDPQLLAQLTAIYGPVGAAPTLPPG